MKKVVFLLLVIGVVSLLGFLWFGNSQKVTAPGEKQTTNNISPTENNDSAVPSNMETNNARDKAGTSSVTAKYKDYLAGKINKAEMMEAVILERNMQNQDFYGKVVDQYGNPVVGAIVKGNVMLDSLQTSREEAHTTETDRMGFFQFTGLHGASLGLTINKEGYEMANRGQSYKGASGQITSTSDRAIFTMWKPRGAEQMKHVAIESQIPYDGKKANDGDLRISVLRSPLELKPGLLRPYDWQVNIQLINGGIIEEDDTYPFWASADGYQPYFEASMDANRRPWRPEFIQNFYFKNSQGQYGLLFINLSTSSKDPETGITIEAWINPSGSQNLEFDPTKQIH
jgi:hypothetical protein